MLKILPQLFYQSPDVDKILVDGLSCIIHKKLSAPVLHKEGYVSSHAITLVLKGTLRVENDRGFRVEVPENKMICLPKGLYTISDIIPDKEEFEAIVFFFEDDVVQSFLKSVKPEGKKDKCIPYLVLDYTSDLRVFTESLIQLYKNRKQLSADLTKLKLLEWLHLIHYSRQTSSLAKALGTLCNKERKSLHAFMLANYSKPLSIEDYAYLSGRSLSTFRRDFINQFGMSPKQWLIEKRLDKAHQLLSANHTSVSHVAMEVGYENISHFIKAFHKRYAISPKQFLMRRRKAELV